MMTPRRKSDPPSATRIGRPELTDPAPEFLRAGIRTPLRDVSSDSGAGLWGHIGSTPAGAHVRDDADLMDALGQGEAEALEALYDRYSSLVFSVGLRMLRDPQLAEDVVQEVFVRLWRQPASFDPERGRFISWLMSVTRNRALDELRRISRRTRTEDRESDEHPLDALPTHDRMDDPVLGVELLEQREVVQAAMTRLPPEQRRVIELAYFSGLTQTEISDVTGEPLGTVKTRTRLGMQKLREALGPLVEVDRAGNA